MMNKLQQLVSNGKFTSFVGRLTMVLLFFSIIVNFILYIPYVLRDDGRSFIPSQYLFFVFISTSLLFYMIYSKKRLKYQILKVRMMIKNNSTEKTSKDELDSVIAKVTSEIRTKLLIKNIAIALVGILLASIIFYSDGILEFVTMAGLLILLIYYYNSSEVDPAEVKDSMKYDRQFVDLDGGMAAYSFDARN